MKTMNHLRIVRMIYSTIREKSYNHQILVIATHLKHKLKTMNDFESRFFVNFSLILQYDHIGPPNP